MALKQTIYTAGSYQNPELIDRLMVSLRRNWKAEKFSWKYISDGNPYAYFMIEVEFHAPVLAAHGDAISQAVQMWLEGYQAGVDAADLKWAEEMAEEDL